jgi:hypothetical protein
MAQLFIKTSKGLKMSYKNEFSDFDYDLPNLGENWQDNSWHNDVCPSLDYPLGGDKIIRIWFDYDNPEMRECGGQKYCLAIGEYCTLEPLMNSDDLAEVLAYIEEKQLKRLFQATWGEGYATQETRLLTMGDITENNGYFEWGVELVDELQVGQTANLSDMSGDLFIKRVK